MKRADLYNLVWERPVTHVAKEYGISDVAIRKICIKHGIPTPPLGYWAKLHHGKKANRAPLPPLADGQSDLDVYLHDTPVKELLQRARRFFSHGCIRVDDARGLALALLQRDSGWTAAAIDRAINEDATSRIPVGPALPVYVTYFTSTVDAGGVVAFYDDVYDRDARLISALFLGQAAAVTGGGAPAASVGCDG